MLLSLLIGSGAQILAAVLITLSKLIRFTFPLIVLVFAVLGFLSPANRGGLITTGIVSFAIMGIVGGYTSSRTYRMLGGIDWKKTTFLYENDTCHLTLVDGHTLPWHCLHYFDYIEYCYLKSECTSYSYWDSNSPFGLMDWTLLPPGVFWKLFGQSDASKIVLIYLIGFQPPEYPVKTNQIPRHIPQPVWYKNPMLVIILSGVLPFGTSKKIFYLY